jgi:hypothetical protein
LTAVTASPFRFLGCIHLLEGLGRRAYDERELLDLLEQAPHGALVYHTYGHFLRHHSGGRPYGNDFAAWTILHARDRLLGERLAVVDPADFGDLELFREELVSIIDDHLSRRAGVPRVDYGEPFHLIQAHVVTVPTGHEARTLAELRQGLAEVESSAVYYHALEARVRLGHGDFEEWLATALGREDLAAAVRRVDVAFSALERVRARLLGVLDAVLDQEATG